MSLRGSAISFTLVLGLGLLASPVRAAQIEESFPFAGVALPELMLDPGTRAPAMGGAGAVFSEDLSSLHWNPAGLDRSRALRAEFSHLSWIEGVSQEALAFGLPLLGGSAAAGLSYVGLGEIERTGIDPQGQPVSQGGMLGLSLLGLDLGYGRPAPWGGSVGVALKLRNESLGERTLLGLAADLGLQWPLGESGVTLGAVLHNLGLPVNGYPLPLGVRAGAGYVLEPASDHRLGLAAEAEVPLPAASQALVHAGLEYSYAGSWFVRCGYCLSDLSRTTSGAGPTAGLGVTFSGWTLGYAFAPQGEFGTAHRLSLAVDLSALAKGVETAPRPPGRTVRETPAAAPYVPALSSKDRSEPLSYRPGGLPSLSADEQAMRQLIRSNLTVKSEVQRGAGGGVLFTVTRGSGPRIQSWSLILLGPSGNEVTTLRGSGLPEAIPWDLKDRSGRMTDDLKGLSFRLILTDINKNRETAEGRVLAEAAAAGTPGGEEEPVVNQSFKGITFDLGRAEIGPDAAKSIARIAEFARRYPRAKVLIEGYCDPIDESENALILSKARAEAVARYLTAYHKVSMRSILLKARGAREPLVASGDPAQRYRNRRVEITVRNTP